MVERSKPTDDYEYKHVDGDLPVVQELPSLSEVNDQFQPLQNLLFDCNIPEASTALRKALGMYTKVIYDSKQRSTRQIRITNILHKSSIEIVLM